MIGRCNNCIKWKKNDDRIKMIVDTNVDANHSANHFVCSISTSNRLSLEDYALKHRSNIPTMCTEEL